MMTVLAIMVVYRRRFTKKRILCAKLGSNTLTNNHRPTDLVKILVESSATIISGLPPERIMDGTECLFEFNANIVKTLLDDYIIPTNSRVNLISFLFGCESEGTWRIFQITR